MPVPIVIACPNAYQGVEYYRLLGSSKGDADCATTAVEIVQVLYAAASIHGQGVGWLSISQGRLKRRGSAFPGGCQESICRLARPLLDLAFSEDPCRAALFCRGHRGLPTMWVCSPQLCRTAISSLTRWAGQISNLLSIHLGSSSEALETDHVGLLAPRRVVSRTAAALFIRLLTGIAKSRKSMFGTKLRDARYHERWLMLRILNIHHLPSNTTSQ